MTSAESYKNGLTVAFPSSLGLKPRVSNCRAKRGLKVVVGDLASIGVFEAENLVEIGGTKFAYDGVAVDCYRVNSPHSL
jgi:hypothetical protein